MSCEDHRSPSSALSLLTSFATSTSVLVLTISPLLAQTPLHFLWRQNVCGLLWEAFHHAVAAKNKEKPLPRPAHPLLARSQHLSPPAQYPGGLGVPCPGDSAPLSRKGAPLLLFPSVVSPASSSTKEVLPLRKGSASYLQSACDHLDQVRREEKPIGLHFLRSSFTNNRADAFSPGSASQLVETPQG